MNLNEYYEEITSSEADFIIDLHRIIDYLVYHDVPVTLVRLGYELDITPSELSDYTSLILSILDKVEENIRYDKAIIEEEAIKSVINNKITEPLGAFIYQRAVEVSGSAFITNGDSDLKQALVDEAVMRVLEKFLYYYKEGGLLRT